MKHTLFLISIIFSTLYLKAQTPDETLVRNTLAEQTTAWNNGDLEKFMDGYWRSDSLVFIGQKGPTYGWGNTLNNYKKNLV